MSSNILELGFIQIKWYSFFILVAIISAYIIIIKEAKKKKIPEEFISNLFFYGIIIGIIGARLYYVLFNLSYYLKYPEEIIMIWNGGLAIHGGIIATLVFLLIYSKKKNMNPLLLTDIIAVALLLAQSIGRWGNFFNGEAYGRVVSLSFLKKLHLPNFIIKGMYIDGMYREPTFLYESILSCIGFLVIILIRKKKKIKTGTLTGLYLLWYGVERLIIESFRSDSLMLGSIKMAQIVSAIAILIGLYFILIKSKKNNYYYEEKIGGTNV